MTFALTTLQLCKHEFELRTLHVLRIVHIKLTLQEISHLETEYSVATSAKSVSAWLSD